MNYKKIILIIVLILILLLLGLFLYNYIKKHSSFDSNTNYSSNKLSVTNNTDYNTNNSLLNSSNTNFSNTISENYTPQEVELTSFTTKIYTKDSERQNNISITCSTLNDTIIENESTFSFCDTVGKATSDKGYEKADVFKKGKVTKALGGGNCQVSTTLYNAVLTIPELEVTERHTHSNSVPYIEKGKDAAVAYGSYDFKFVNHLGSKLKIKAEPTENEVIIKLFKIYN